MKTIEEILDKYTFKKDIVKAIKEYATACIKADRGRVAEAAKLAYEWSNEHYDVIPSVDKQSILTHPIELI